MFLRNTTRIFIYLGLVVTSIALLSAAPVFAQVVECDLIDFEQFTHADGITSIDLFGGTVTIGVAAFRNAPGGNVNATAYDTDYSFGEGGCANLLDGTHKDTQIPTSFGLVNPPGICADCDGIIMNVPDVDFCAAGDDTQGGVITFSGFSSDFSWEIPSYEGVDADDSAQDILLRVGVLKSLVGSTDCDSNPDCGDGEVVIVTTDPHSFTEVAEFTMEGSGGIDNIEVCRTSEPGGEGCTPGFWKQDQHLDLWPVDPNTPFDAFFDDAFSGLTLLEVARLRGGGLNRLGAHTVAAFLNAASSSVNYPLTEAEVIALFNAVFPGTRAEYNALKDIFVEFNELVCPIG